MYGSATMVVKRGGTGLEWHPAVIALLNILLMATFTALGTFVAIRAPFVTWGVPLLPGAEELVHWRGLIAGLCTITLQVPMVWLSGLALGPWQGMAAQAVLLVVGLSGLPIFLEGGGLDYLQKPTFGYLLGFLPAACVAGLFARKGPAAAFAGMALGQVAMWAVGVPWQVVATRPGGFLDGSVWSRSWAGVLQIAPTYAVLMLGIALALGVGNAILRSIRPSAEPASGSGRAAVSESQEAS